MDSKLILLGGLLLCCFFGKIERSHAQETTESEVVLSVEEYKQLLLTLIEAKRRRMYLRTYGTLPPPSAGSSTARTGMSPLDSLQTAIYQLEDRLRAERLRDRLYDTEAEDPQIGLNLPPATEPLPGRTEEQRRVDSLTLLLAELRKREVANERYARTEMEQVRRNPEPVYPERGRDTIYLTNPYRQQPADRYEYREPNRRAEGDYATGTPSEGEWERQRYEQQRTQMMLDRMTSDRDRLERDLNADYQRSRQESAELRREIAELRRLYSERQVAFPSTSIGQNAVQPQLVTPVFASPTDTLAGETAGKLNELQQRMAMMEARLNVELAAARERTSDQQSFAVVQQNNRALENQLNESQREVLRLQAQVAELQRRMAETPKPAPVTPAPALPRVVPVPVPTTSAAADYIARRPMTAVYFANGSGAVDAEGRRTLDRTIDEVRNFSEIEFVIKGFTSPSGSIAVNRRLARERAEVVHQYLVRRGIAPARLRIDPVGIDTGASSSAMARRAEVILSIR